MDEVKSIVNRLQAQLMAGASAADLYITASKLCHILGHLQPKPSPSTAVSVVLPAGYQLTGQPAEQPASIAENAALEHARALLASTEAFLPQSQWEMRPTPPPVPNPAVNTSTLVVPRPPVQPSKSVFLDEETAIERLMEEEMVPFESEPVDDKPLIVELLVDSEGDEEEGDEDSYAGTDVLVASPALPKTVMETMQYNSVLPKQESSISTAEITERNQALGKPITELAEVLAKPKIKDLRKAISINDKFRLVHELFRDDEAMFERSLKTLNNFGTLQEAAYWAQRELVVKLGWEDDNEMVQLFYDMLKRRFD